MRNTEQQVEIRDHRDGFGLNDLIDVYAMDFSEQGMETPPREAVPHRFHFCRRTGVLGDKVENQVGFLQFQNGPRDEDGLSTPGLTSDAVIHALLAYLRAANKAFPSKETACAITHLEEAAHWLHARARERARRGVLGKAKA